MSFQQTLLRDFFDHLAAPVLITGRGPSRAGKVRSFRCDITELSKHLGRDAMTGDLSTSLIDAYHADTCKGGRCECSSRVRAPRIARLTELLELAASMGFTADTAEETAAPDTPSRDAKPERSPADSGKRVAEPKDAPTRSVGNRGMSDDQVRPGPQETDTPQRADVIDHDMFRQKTLSKIEKAFEEFDARYEELSVQMSRFENRSSSSALAVAPDTVEDSPNSEQGDTPKTVFMSFRVRSPWAPCDAPNIVAGPAIAGNLAAAVAVASSAPAMPWDALPLHCGLPPPVSTTVRISTR